MNNSKSGPKRVKYQQDTDSTLKPFMRSGETLIGSKAIEGQTKKRTVRSEEVRVRALPSSQTRRNEGLHEVIPTNMRNEFGGSKDFAYIQSGLRTSPSETVFRREGGELGGHTQSFVKSSGQGSTHTKGQGPAHDKLRDEFRRSKKRRLSGPVTASNMMSAQIRSTASGPEIMKSDYLTGSLPNSLDSSGPLESPKAKSKPNREKFASGRHNQREESKRRLFAYSQQSLSSKEGFQFAPPSPLRAPMEEGGGYLSAPFPLPQIPEFPSTATLAHSTAWMTEPLRSKKDK